MTTPAQQRTGRAPGDMWRGTPVSTSQPPSQCHITHTWHLPPMQNIDQASTPRPTGSCLESRMWALPADDDTTVTPPVPASWAPACGVDHRWDNDDTWGHQNQQQQYQMMHHLPPVSWATAHGVGHWWSPRGKIHNLRLSCGDVGSKCLSFSLCGGLLVHSYLENLLASCTSHCASRCFPILKIQHWEVPACAL